jgi:hypothetical protein
VIETLADIDRYDALSIYDRQRTYERVMSNRDRKRMGELRAFRGFIVATGLPVDPASVRCLAPPRPDIACSLAVSPYLFELGEVTDQGLAQRMAHSLKTGMITGGAASQTEALERIITLKLGKTYATHGVPVDLLLYYWWHPAWPAMIYQTLQKSSAVISSALARNVFSRIWVYEHQGKGLLIRLP